MSPTRAACASLLVLLFAGAGRAQDDAVLDVPAGEAPVFDGKLEEGEWARSAHFAVTRGEDMYGRGYLRRVGRDLYFAYDGKWTAFATGLRLNFLDPGSRRGIVVLFVPLAPPRAPLGAWLERPGKPAEWRSVVRGDLRMHFEGMGAWSAELRLPLDLLEIGRPAMDYAFSVELWDLIANRAVAAYPMAAEGPAVGRGDARLRPVGDWGVDAPIEEELPPVNEALALLERIDREPPPSDDPEEGVLTAFLGTLDGRRREAPLADLEKSLRQLIEAYPAYASLRFNLVRVLSGRNDPHAALAAMDGMREDFPMLRFNVQQLLVRMQLLRDLGRYGDALAVLDEGKEVLEGHPALGIEGPVLESLRLGWKVEQEIRAEEAERDDLPRVRLQTTKGPILLELFEDDAPNGVANFVSLVEKGFYDGTRFHWVASGGSIIGGDPNSRDDDPHNDGYGDPGYMIESEPGRRQNFHYTVAFADKRRSRRAEGSAFVIHIAPQPVFDGVNTVLGRVVEGEEAIRRLEYYDAIEKATVVRKRNHTYEPVKR